MNKKYLWVIPIMFLVFGTTMVLADTQFTNAPTDASIVRADTSATATSNLSNNLNTTVQLLNNNGQVVNFITTAGNSSTLSINFQSMSAGVFTLHAIANNGTATETATDRTFTITGCSTSDYAIWAVISLVFIVGLIYFAYTGFIEGNPAKLVTFIIMLTIVSIIVGNFSLSIIKLVC